MNLATDSYLTIEEKTSCSILEKGSRFIAIAFPVSSTDEIKHILLALKKQYYDARHICYAYILDIEKPITKSSDDGEPAGTAGYPILGQLRSFNLTNTLLAVVRYFGGTKLGVSGLISAYKRASQEAINNARIITKHASQRMVVSFEYAQMNAIMNIIKINKLPIITSHFDLQSEVTLEIRGSKLTELLLALDKVAGTHYAIVNKFS